MAENFGLSRRVQPNLKDKAKKVPVKVIKEFIPCDSDTSCDRAQFEVIVRIEDGTKSLYFCGHHMRALSLLFFERGYEVVKL